MTSQAAAGRTVSWSVVIFRDSGGWVAQALEHDFAGEGRTKGKAVRALAMTVRGYMFIAENEGIDDPLTSVPPAPQQYWEMFERAGKHSNEASELDAPGLPLSFAINAIADHEMRVQR